MEEEEQDPSSSFRDPSMSRGHGVMAQGSLVGAEAPWGTLELLPGGSLSPDRDTWDAVEPSQVVPPCEHPPGSTFAQELGRS